MGDISDVEVRCGDLVVKAHKAVLTSYSTTFYTAFNNPHLGERNKIIYFITFSGGKVIFQMFLLFLTQFKETVVPDKIPA
jgi:hypothetical protein